MGEELINNYLKDILRHISEIEQVKADAKDIDGFKSNFYFKRTSIFVRRLVRHAGLFQFIHFHFDTPTFAKV